MFMHVRAFELLIKMSLPLFEFKGAVDHDESSVFTKIVRLRFCMQALIILFHWLYVWEKVPHSRYELYALSVYSCCM